MPNPRRGAFTVANTEMTKFLQNFLNPDPDYQQNLIDWSMDYVQPFHKFDKD